MSENKDTMVDDAIEWLNEIRCWINRCKDTDWGDDDQRIVDFITSALQSPRVPVIKGLDEAIEYVNDFATDVDDEGLDRDGNSRHFFAVVKAALAYAELQKGV